MVVAGRSAMTPRTLVRGQEAATSHRRPRTICQATADARNMEDTFTARAVSMLFKFPPLWEAARKKARQTIVDRAEAIGVDWHGQMRRLSAVDWEAEMAAVRDPALAMPDYYTKPFHGARPPRPLRRPTIANNSARVPPTDGMLRCSVPVGEPFVGRGARGRDGGAVGARDGVQHRRGGARA
ncbi:unnamed protein product [Pedinophyceae sp. YPF-701]|nr:unnamed protein product [Pedinophyceae sp. YPF-701]